MSNYLIYDFQWSSDIAYIITHGWSINEKIFQDYDSVSLRCLKTATKKQVPPASAPGDAEQWALDPASRDVGSEKPSELRTCLPRNFLKMERLWNLFIYKNPSK